MKNNYFSICGAFVVGMVLCGSVVNAANAVAPAHHGVTVDDKMFAGKKVTVLLSGSGTAHEEVRNQKSRQDYWILQSPKIVQIGHNSYLKGRALNGPTSFKGKVVWIELSKVLIIREE